MGSRRPTICDLGSMMTLTSVPPSSNPAPAAWFLDDDDEAAGSPCNQLSLDECRMCGMNLQRNDDIYMYRGDTPFCSEDCRDEQIRMDQHEERTNRRRRRARGASAAGSSSAQVKSRAAAVAVGAV